MSQANRYLGGFCSSQRIFPPQIIQVLLIHPPAQGKPLGLGGKGQTLSMHLAGGPPLVCLAPGPSRGPSLTRQQPAFLRHLWWPSPLVCPAQL